jgi:hypothetical protein
MGFDPTEMGVAYGQDPWYLVETLTRVKIPRVWSNYCPTYVILSYISFVSNLVQIWTEMWHRETGFDYIPQSGDYRVNTNCFVFHVYKMCHVS